MKHKKKKLLLTLKLLFAFGGIAYVLSKIDTQQLMQYLTQIHPGYLIGASVALAFAQVVSSLRMRYYFATVDLHFSRYFAVALYWIGTFFNLILPGGIGGDGYKIYLLSKLHNFSKLMTLRRIVSGRASGLFILILLAGGMAYFSDMLEIIPYGFWLNTIGLILVIPAYFISIKLLLQEEPKVALEAAKYSFIVQGLCVVTAYLLFVSLGMDMGSMAFLDYLVLFLVSSIVSILPISIGGAGLREITFLYGATFFNLDKEIGVAFSLVYFVINAVISFVGLYFFMHIKQIAEKETSLEKAI